MRNVIVSVLVALVFSGAFAVESAFGAVQLPFGKDRATTRVSSQKPPSGGAFFGVLEPRTSSTGAVKTFLVKKAVPRVTLYDREMMAAKPLKINVIDTVIPKDSGSWMCPVAGEISSQFGYRRHPLRHHGGTRFHSGIDIRARRGTPIRAALSGKVIFAGWRNGYGRTVEIDHGNGYKTVYAHCSNTLVAVGTQVPRGKIIAQVGSTGVATGCHLHYEVRRSGALLNPFHFIR